MFSEVEWVEFCCAGSAGNQSPAPLRGRMSNFVKNTWIRAAKLGGFLRWGGRGWCVKFGG